MVCVFFYSCEVLMELQMWIFQTITFRSVATQHYCHSSLSSRVGLQGLSCHLHKKTSNTFENMVQKLHTKLMSTASHSTKWYVFKLYGSLFWQHCFKCVDGRILHGVNFRVDWVKLYIYICIYIKKHMKKKVPMYGYHGNRNKRRIAVADEQWKGFSVYYTPIYKRKYKL